MILYQLNFSGSFLLTFNAISETHSLSPFLYILMCSIVYQTNSMLDMSNGYPNSASPLGGSPSPGQSPNMGVHHNKC